MAKHKKLDFVTNTWLEELMSNLGGVENIKQSTHCLTRMRIVALDENKVNKDAIAKMEGVKGIFVASGQLQIVLGTDVAKIYQLLANKYNLAQSTKADIKKTVANQGNWFKRFLNWMSDIFIPIVPVLVSGGIILGLRNIFEATFSATYFTGKFDAGGNPVVGWSMVNVSQFMNGLDAFLWIPAQVAFWWLPVHICWSIFRKMDADQILGVVLGLSLLVSPLINTYEFTQEKGIHSLWIWDIASQLRAQGKDSAFDWGFMKYPWKIAYTSQVIPAMGVGIVGAYINLWIRRVSPGTLTQILVPTVTIIPTYVFALFIIGPIGYVLGSCLGFAFQWALTNKIAKYFFAIIIGGLHAGIVITGMHNLLNAVMIQSVAQYGGDFVFMSVCAQCLGQGSAVIGWMILKRKDPKSKEVGGAAVVAAYLGVSEPALYGVNIKYLYPFIAGSIGAAAALEICVISGTTAQSIGNGAWLGILSVQIESKAKGVTTWPGTGYAWFLIANLVGTALAISLTIIFGKMPVFKKFDPNYKPEDFKKDINNKKMNNVVEENAY